MIRGDMKNKETAMRQFIEWMIEESQVIPVQAEDCYNKAKELLEIEKEQIKETFDNGVYVGTYAVDKDGEEYYYETYNK